MAISGLGPIIQIAMVVPDLERSVAAYVALGAGPFFRLEASPTTVTHYRGAVHNSDHVLAIGYWGDQQIEIIQQRCDTPSVYKEYADAGLDGVHHVLTTTEDMDALLASIDADGHEVLALLELGEAGRVIYLRLKDQPWPLIEIGEFGPAIGELFAMVRDASIGWDGSNPLRDLVPAHRGQGG